jgi:asparagine N-glycosylation enzyme membrane subunit Stt3
MTVGRLWTIIKWVGLSAIWMYVLGSVAYTPYERVMLAMGAHFWPMGAAELCTLLLVLALVRLTLWLPLLLRRPRAGRMWLLLWPVPKMPRQ